VIDPCIPSDWKKYKVVRKFRGAVYNINVMNKSGAESGVSSITINGDLLDGNVIPVQKAGSVVNVDVMLG
jgi:cellobiose phosphorylase